jgi:SAM-dependent methyltransferase
VQTSSDKAQRERRETCLVCGKSPTVQPGAFACAACGVDLTREPDGAFIAHHETALSYPDDGAALLAGTEDTSFWFRHRNDVIAALLERFPVDGPLWDVGGGNGYQARMLERSGRVVVLVEPGATGCKNALSRGVSAVVRATLDAVKLPPASLAAVTLFDVIEHLEDPARLLGECRRVLRANGRLLVTVPAYETLWSDEDDYAQHHRRYTRSRLEQELRGAGFSIDYASYFFQPLVAPIFLLRSLPYRLSGKRSVAQSTDVGEHAPGGLSQRAVEWLLARELTAMRAGAELRFGGSIVAVARPSGERRDLDLERPQRV